jgi:uncharacterized protein YbjQ (UPF0145 family)
VSAVILTTGSAVEGRSILDYVGIVRGIAVRVPSRHQRSLGSNYDYFQVGNIERFAEVCDAAYQDAVREMITHAESVDADAVVAIRVQTAPFAAREGITEVIAYGTAVKLAR